MRSPYGIRRRGVKLGTGAPLCYMRAMRERAQPGRKRKRTASRVSAAAARAVDAVLSSHEAFALLVRRLEEAGWHVARDAGDDRRDPPLTPPPRAR
jgi:hypothetical protein